MQKAQQETTQTDLKKCKKQTGVRVGRFGVQIWGLVNISCVVGCVSHNFNPDFILS